MGLFGLNKGNKEILLVRHAKSDWGNEILKDVDRPLNQRGYNDAYQSAEWFKKTKKVPDAILSSTATRALSTALIFARVLEFDMSCFHLNELLYETSVPQLFETIQQQDSNKNNLMIFFHNPTITDFCNMLSDDKYFDNIPTCGIISYSLDIKNWADIKSKTGKLNYFQFPKNL